MDPLLWRMSSLPFRNVLRSITNGPQFLTEKSLLVTRRKQPAMSSLNNNIRNLNTHRRCLNDVRIASFPHSRNLHTTTLVFSKYEYDPSTDSFRKRDSNESDDRPAYTRRESSTDERYAPQERVVKRSGKLKILFVVLGFSTAVLLYLISEVKVEVINKININDELQLQMVATERLRELCFYDYEDAFEEKEDLLFDLISKLAQETEITDNLGSPVQFVGFSIAQKISSSGTQKFLEHDQHSIHGKVENEITAKRIADPSLLLLWEPVCYVEGSAKLARLQLTCKRTHSGDPWYLTRVHLETVPIQGGGEVICDIEGGPPNGLNHFTKFSS